MKIRTLKIKVEQETQEYCLETMFTTHNDIHSTTATLVKENKQYFWHVLISYVPNRNFYSNVPRYSNDEDAPYGFKEEINNFIENSKNKIPRVKNCIRVYQNQLYKIQKLEDFNRIRGIGKKSIYDDQYFLNSILNIINKHKRKNKHPL